jgi:hypothetical protein
VLHTSLSIDLLKQVNYLLVARQYEADSLIDCTVNLLKTHHNLSVNLLKKSSDLFQKKKEDIDKLIQGCQPHLERIEKHNRDEAPNFNVFSALGILRKEVIQSRFLAYLLSPHKHHNQGAKFLKLFMELIGETSITKLEEAKVYPEVPIDEFGRTDIFIDIPNILVVIENKISASEGDKQLERYQKYMEKQPADKKKLVFLTPQKQAPISHDPEHSIQPISISYIDLAELFEKIDPKTVPKSVYAVISQYATACRLITLGEMSMTAIDDDILSLINTDNNLKTVLFLEQQAFLIRQKIIKDFIENVTKIVEKELEPHNSTWIVGKWNLGLEIKTIINNPNYSLRLEGIFGDNDKNIGWVRPSWVNVNDMNNEYIKETNDISTKMKKQRFSYNNWWVGVKTRSTYLTSNNDHIVKCDRDNKTDEHPLAKEIAEEFMRVFIDYHEDICNLPTFITKFGIASGSSSIPDDSISDENPIAPSDLDAASMTEECPTT